MYVMYADWEHTWPPGGLRLCPHSLNKVCRVGTSPCPGKPIHTASCRWMSLRIDLLVCQHPPCCRSSAYDASQCGLHRDSQTQVRPPHTPPPVYPAIEGHWLTFISTDMKRTSRLGWSWVSRVGEKLPFWVVFALKSEFLVSVIWH